jgi:hypothetical protein
MVNREALGRIAKSWLGPQPANGMFGGVLRGVDTDELDVLFAIIENMKVLDHEEIQRYAVLARTFLIA